MVDYPACTRPNPKPSATVSLMVNSQIDLNILSSQEKKSIENGFRDGFVKVTGIDIFQIQNVTLMRMDAFGVDNKKIKNKWSPWSRQRRAAGDAKVEIELAKG